MSIHSKLPNVGTTIFTVMSQLASEHNAINLAQGFPNFDCDTELKEKVAHYMNIGKNQYVPMAGVPELRQAISNKINSIYNRQLDVDSEITVTAGATQAIMTAILALVKKGDEVIIFEPAYDCYLPSIELVGARAVPYQLKAPDFKIDWVECRALVTDKTRMIIINTPHNPTGQVLSSEDMRFLNEMTENTDTIILSDEVYEHIIFDGLRHESVLYYEELYKRSLVVFSFGKTFHNTGWKTGYAVGPDYLMKEFKKVHQFNVFSVNSFVQYGLADYLKSEEKYNVLPAFYQAKRDCFEEAMSASSLRPLKCEGTYFQLYDYSSVSDENDMDFARRLTQDYGVAVIPISVFYHDRYDNKVVRFCFAKTEDVLQEAGQRLASL